MSIIFAISPSEGKNYFSGLLYSESKAAYSSLQAEQK